MANFHGSLGVVKVATNTVAEVTSFEVSERAAFAEDTTLADTDVTYNTTNINSWSGSLTCFWDDTDTNGQEALTAGASVTLHLLPEGTTTGDEDLNGTALIEEVSVTVQKGAITERTFSFVGSGALTYGTAA